MRHTSEPRKMSWLAAQYYLRPMLGVWLLFAAIIVPGVVSILWSHRSLSQDLRGAVPQQGTGVVTGIVYDHPNPKIGDRSSPILLSLDGRPVVPNLVDPTLAPPLQEGDSVTFTYRVGRSGKWYIDWIVTPPYPR